MQKIEAVTAALKTVSGSVLAVDDVSSIEHELCVQLSGEATVDFSTVTVTRCGKNWFDGVLGVVDMFGDTTKYRRLSVTLPPGTYTFSFSVPIYLQANNFGAPCMVYQSSVTVNVKERGTYYLQFRRNDDAAWEGTEQIQLEVGETATLYEAYNGQKVIANADGTVSGLMSVSPNMTILCDAPGVVIDCTYNTAEKVTLWEKPLDSFADASWEEIIAAAQNDDIPESWKVGDVKTVTYNGKEYSVAIAGMHHDIYYYDGREAPLTLATWDETPDYAMRDSSNIGGNWIDSDLRDELNGSGVPWLPDVVRNAIRPVLKETSYMGDENETPVLEENDESLFLFSGYELDLYSGVYSENEGSMYEWYDWPYRCWTRSITGAWNEFATTDDEMISGYESRGLLVGFCL